MHIHSLQLKGFKRFTDLTIRQIPPSAKLVVLIGPNGSGKSSLFDAFKIWLSNNSTRRVAWDEIYHRKVGYQDGSERRTINHNARLMQAVKIDFQEGIPPQELRKKMIYVRSAYRNEPDFKIQKLTRMGSILDGKQVSKMIDNDMIVSENYLRLISASVDGIYNGEHDEKTVAALREEFIGEVRCSIERVFGDLILSGPGDPLSNGAFYFDKGACSNFHYKNLSGGEKAAFDLILDILVKRREFNDTIFAIDEPGLHMHSGLQAMLLEELYGLIPETSQLWIATHSMGMMKKAKEIKEANPKKVVFFDFTGHDFDGPVVLKPAEVDRSFWANTLKIALADLAELVAPSRIVLCEGEFHDGPASPRTDFDANCYRIIFEKEFPETEFLSAGNCSDVENDRLSLGRSLGRLFRTMNIIRVVDRDDKSPQEITALTTNGIRVLSKRHLESYLLDDEIIKKLCQVYKHEDLLAEALKIKRDAINNSVGRGKSVDDIKSASGEIMNGLKRLLSLTGCGNNTEAFLRDTMTHLITPDTEVYSQLKSDIFSEV